jgi:hypothetical protein
MLGLSVIAVVSVLTIVVAVAKPRNLLFLYVAALPFYGVIAEVGLQVTPYLVVSIAMGLVMLFNLSVVRLPKQLLVFITYAIVVTVVMSIFLPDRAALFPLLRGKLRWLSQITVFILLVLPIIFVVQWRINTDTLKQMVRIFLGSTALLCVTGIYQLVMFDLTGKDVFPINMFSGLEGVDKYRSGMTRITESLKILRMSGLGGGEPKNFGYTCTIAFILNLHAGLMGLWKTAGRLPWRWIYGGLYAAGILLSLSTQAYLLIGLCLSISLLAMIIRFGVLNRRSLVMIGLVVVGLVGFTSNAYVRRLIELRIYERLAVTGIVEDFNQAISGFLEANPEFLVFGTGLGNVHFWASDYIPREFVYYARDSVFVAKAGFLRLISELGVLGLGLFSMIFLFPINGLRHAFFSREQPWAFLLFTFAVQVFISFMFTADASPFYIMSLVMLYAYRHSSRTLETAKS